MQRPSPFLALLKLELLRSATVYTNPLAWVMMLLLLGCNLMPALAVWLRPDLPIFLLLLQGWAHMMLFWWLAVLIIECSGSLLQGITSVLGPLGVGSNHWAEFLSTRAIDRRLHFRAKTIMFVVMFCLPMLANLVLVGVLTGRIAPQAGTFADTSVEERLSLAPGEVAGPVAVVMVWASLAIIVFAQGYYGLISRWFGARRNWGAVLLAVAPVFALLAWIFVFHLNLESMDRFSPQVQFFFDHWPWFALAVAALAVPVQRLCEKSFANQEVL